MLTNYRRSITFSLGIMIFCVGVYALRAEDEPKQGEGDAIYQVPDTEDPAELIAFIKEVRSAKPLRPRGPAEYREAAKYRRAAPVAIAAAAEKIFELTDKKSEHYADASVYLLKAKVDGFSDADTKEREQIIEDVQAHLKKHGVRREEASVAFGILQELEHGDSKLAAKTYMAFAKLFKQSDNKEVRELASRLEGPARRLGMVGSKMEVFGKTLEGEEFDWEAYRGKVVLIDFWATWCGPCLAELPNIKKAYEKYHDKGFDVVGISLDDDRSRLKSYLEKNPVPWTQLHQATKGNDMAKHYGVRGIPFIVLVGKDGKVITTNARGPQLEQELEKIFGSSTATE